MFTNLNILMINNKVDTADLANELNTTERVICSRLSGVTEFKLDEMLKIKKKFFPDYTLDQIFDDSIKLIENIK